MSNRATGDKCCTFGFTDLGIVMYFLKLRCIDHRTNIYAFIQAVAEAQLFNAWYEPVHELFAHCFVYYDAAASGTTLTRGAVGAPQNALDGKIKVGIIHHDHSILATHLQRYSFERLRGLNGNVAARGSGAGEGDNRDVGMAQQGIANSVAGAEDDVDHAFWQARVVEGLNQPQRAQG